LKRSIIEESTPKGRGFIAENGVYVTNMTKS
jgi:hypothetical protein